MFKWIIGCVPFDTKLLVNKWKCKEFAKLRYKYSTPVLLERMFVESACKSYIHESVNKFISL